MRRTFTGLAYALSLFTASVAYAAEGEHGEEHGAAPHGSSEHGGEHVPSFDEINWFYGFLGERDEVEPDLLFRPKGMPAPFGALLLNTAILYYILYRVLGKPIREGLVNRKATILKGMEEAAKMKREAEEQLQKYEDKLAGIDQDVARIQLEMRQAGEAERSRILNEARERRARMERDAELLISQELKATRELLLRETAESAVRSAERLLKERLGPTDHQALAEAHLTDLRSSAASLRGRL